MSGALTRHDETTRIACREDVFAMGLEIQSFLHKIHVVSEERRRSASVSLP